MTEEAAVRHEVERAAAQGLPVLAATFGMEYWARTQPHPCGFALGSQWLHSFAREFATVLNDFCPRCLSRLERRGDRLWCAKCRLRWYVWFDTQKGEYLITCGNEY